jgi:hypothetical protein
MTTPGRHSGARGASLVGILMIVVVLGGLMALGVVGISSLNNSNDNLKSAGIVVTPTTSTPGSTTGGAGGNGVIRACSASADAARAASAVYYANTGGTYPTKWSDLTASAPPTFELPTDVIISPGNPVELSGKGWKLTMTGGGTTSTDFTCSPPQ